MEEHLLKILEANSRVIIPEFGAFIVKQKTPLSIVFNEFLQYNDGLLVDFISREENIERDVAKKKIDDFVKKVREELGKDNMVSFGKMGVLVRSQTGKISLEDADTAAQMKKTQVKPPEPEVQEKSEAESVESADDINLDESMELQQDEEPVRKAPEPVKEKSGPAETKAETTKEISGTEEIKAKSPDKKQKPAETGAKPAEEKPTPPIQQESEKTPEPETRKPETKTPEVHAPEAGKDTKETASHVVQDKKYSSPTERKEYSRPVSTPDSDLESAYRGVQKEDEFLTSTGNKRKRRVGLFIWILVILLVNGAIVAYFLYSDQFGKYFQKKTPQPISLASEDTTGIVEATPDTAQVVTQPPAESKTIQPKSVKTPKPVTVQKEKPVTGPRFYIVAGVFRSEANADALVRKLKNKGYNAEKFGKIRDLYGVSYESYGTKAEADQALLRIKRETDKHAWIKKME